MKRMGVLQLGAEHTFDELDQIGMGIEGMEAADSDGLSIVKRTHTLKGVARAVMTVNSMMTASYLKKMSNPGGM
jgi:hypothetical protein